jgi:N-methylhydantoinase B
MDGVRLAVLSNRFQAIVGSMMNTIFRTGRSGVLNSAHDFSCCVLTADHELIIGAESLPIHMMSGPELISRAVARAHPTLRRGDAYLHNSPYNGNSHPADHTIFVPVMDGSAAHRFSVLAKAHQGDCGNSQPTTYMAGARDVYEEGALIFDACRIQQNYTDNDDLIRMMRLRLRVPDQWWGDYLALLGAVRVGERRVVELGEEVGWAEVDSFIAEWFDYSEGRMGEAIAKLPAGRVEAVSRHDPFVGAPSGVDVRAAVEVDPVAGRISVDLRDNVDCLPNGLNLTEATARTGAMVGVFNSIGATVPPNAGSFRRLDVVLRENCAVGVPRHPVSCSVATTNLADRVANAVQRGLAELGDGIGLAEVGGVIPAAAAVVSGRDPRRGGAPFVNQIFLAVTGGAGAPETDGWLTMFHVGGAGMLQRDSVELTELRYPLIVEAQRLEPDSEGAGRFRGAPGAYVEYGPIGCTVTVSYGVDGVENPALGARGGTAGAPSRHYKRTRDGDVVVLPQHALVDLGDGERIVSVTAGGGGYGNPMERDPCRVQKDVVEGWISAPRARQVYGIAVDGAGVLDRDETASLRSAVANG